MMPSKKRRSAFYNYMVQRKSELESKGHRFPRGLADVANRVSNAWENMSVEDKNKYDDIHQENSEHLPTVSSGGPSYTAETKKETERCLKENVSSWLFSKNPDSIADMVFLLIEFNPWADDYNGNYIPAEIGLLAFTLNSGIIDEYGTLIDPDDAHVGLASSFNHTRDELFLPSLPFRVDEDSLNLRKVVMSIALFVKKHTNNLSPGYLFCRRGRTEVIQSCLQWLAKQSGVRKSFDLYPLENAMMDLSSLEVPNSVTKLTSKTGYAKSHLGNPSMFKTSKHEKLNGETFTDLSQVDLVLDSMFYAHYQHFGCFHHMKHSDAVHNCALAKLNRYAYAAMGSLIANFGIKEHPSIHFPCDALLETYDRVEMLQLWGLKEIEYPSFSNPEERHAKHQAKMAEIRAKAEAVELRDIPETHVAPMFREKGPINIKMLSVRRVKPKY